MPLSTEVEDTGSDPADPRPIVNWGGVEVVGGAPTVTRAAQRQQDTLGLGHAATASYAASHEARHDFAHRAQTAPAEYPAMNASCDASLRKLDPWVRAVTHPLLHGTKAFAPPDPRR